MTVLKYTGRGLISQGIHFNPDFNDGLYEVPQSSADYLLKTFTKDFIMIEKKSEKKEDKKEAPKKASKRAPRRKKKVVEDETITDVATVAEVASSEDE